MDAGTLKDRIAAETGLSIAGESDMHRLAGLFNRYRPDGAGLERLLPGGGIEGAVRSRIQRVFEATAADASSTDLYFVIRRHPPLDRDAALAIAARYVRDFKRFANFIGDSEVSTTLATLKLQAQPPAGGIPDEDVTVMLYECLTDFLAPLNPDRHEIFLLQEALYSMANDYSLEAYMLASAIPLGADADGALDSYFDMWRYGIQLQFFAGGVASISLRE